MKYAKFQSTLPIREETRVTPKFPAKMWISIHSSHTGRDMDKALQASDELISIHSSHTGRDLSADAVSIGSGYNFNPLFPYGKRRPTDHGRGGAADFNPLFPYGKRHWTIKATAAGKRFQSTLPIREETERSSSSSPQRYFNPLFPYGKRRKNSGAANRCPDFNPLFPYGKRLAMGTRTAEQFISIHSSHTGRDPGRRFAAGIPAVFQSTLPIREETLSSEWSFEWDLFQSTLPIREETLAADAAFGYGGFQSTLPIREETQQRVL